MAPQPTIANTSHHHHRLQVQTSHCNHARNVIKSLRGDELIISSGYERTSECFLTMSSDERTPQWSCRACQLLPQQGPRWNLGALVQNDLPLSPRFPIASAPGHAMLGMELSTLHLSGQPSGIPLPTAPLPPAQDAPLESRSNSAELPKTDKGGNRRSCPPSPGFQEQQDPKTHT